MTVMQRRKGNRGEIEFSKAISEHLGETITRELGAARDGGPDLLLGSNWAVEVKRGETLRLESWWDQACEQAAALYRYPALAYRQNRQPWRILVPLDVVLWGIKTWEAQNTLDWAAQVSLPGFATVVRESLRT